MKKVIKDTILVVLLSFIIAVLCYIFGTVLILLSNLAFDLFPYNLILLPLVGILIVFVKNLKKDKLEDSMKKIFHATKINKKLSILIIPFQMITTWLGHLAGASVGREGVALQIGGTVANNFASLFKMDRKMLTSSGKAAGFSALFGTPLGGLFFVYELNHKKISDIYFWYLTILMVYLSSTFASLLGMAHFHQEIYQFIEIDMQVLIKLIVSSLIFVLVGNLFAFLLKWQKEKYKKKFKNEYKRVIVLSMVYIVIMLIFRGRYMSLGTNLITDSFTNPALINNFDFIIKLLVTTFIISIGYQGGEVTPLFATGTTLGVVLARLLGLPLELTAALGYTVVFAAGTNAYLAGFFIALELFGLRIFPYIAICIIVAYLFKNNNGIYNNGVYKKN